MSDGRRRIDLSHRVEQGMPTYPGLPGPSIEDHLTREASRAIYAPGTEFHIGRISMVANTGTYVDSPFHRFADGADLAELPLDRLADLEAVTVDVSGSGRRGIERDDLGAVPLGGRAVLLRTGWSRHWGSPDYNSRAPLPDAGRRRAPGRPGRPAGGHRLAQHR